MMRRVGLALLVFLIFVFPAQAQAGQRCFAETSYCISGRIREYWERNGGLPIFGFPTTEQHEEFVEGKPYQVQWFERSRLELHPENGRPYDVLLSRLGADHLQQQGRDWFTFPKGGEQPSCQYFSQTEHTVCGPFLSYFRTHGLDLGQRGITQAESMALFGLPISEMTGEASPTDGKMYSTQHFERARLELHPENQPLYNVQLGLLGNETRHNIQAAGSGNQLLVANYQDNTISVLDADTLQTLSTIPAGGYPRAIAAVGGEATYPNRAIVANAQLINPGTSNQQGLVQVIDLTTLQVASSLNILITTHGTETTYLYDAAISPDGHCGFVLLTEQTGEQSLGADNGPDGRYDAHSSVHGIDLSNIMAPKDMGSTGDLGQGTVRIAMAPDGSVLLAANTNEGQIQPITWNSNCSPSKGSAFPSSALNSYPSSFAFLTPNQFVVGLYGADGQQPNNIVTFQGSKTSWKQFSSYSLGLNYPVALAPVSSSSFLVAMNTVPMTSTGFVQLWTNGSPSDALPIGVPSAIAVSSDGSQAYVADMAGNQVVSLNISGSSLSAGTPAAVGQSPIALAFVNTGGASAGANGDRSKGSIRISSRSIGAPMVSSTPAGGFGTPLGVLPYTYGGTCADSSKNIFSGRSDPITVVWYGPGIMQSANSANGSAEAASESLGPPGIMQPLIAAGFESTVVLGIETGGPAHIISIKGQNAQCIDLAGQSAYPTSGSVAFNRYHLRLWAALVDAAGNPTTDSQGNYYYVGSPHKETWWSSASVWTCTGSATGNHAVDAGISPGQGGYTLGREFLKSIYANSPENPYGLSYTFAGNSMLEKQCTREFTASDGALLWIYVP